MADYFISVKNLCKRFGSFVALDDISINISEGEFLALLGPSGCGKTTLLRSIAGFVDVQEGDIVIDGKSMKGLPPNHRPVNTVFQNYALFPHMTVIENVAYGPRRNGLGRKAATVLAEESLAMVNMSNFESRYPSQLSGGQQQRIALARAVANRPKVLLLDEPLGALDLKLRKHMQIELKRLQQQLGMTFIFVTHDQEEALVMADRIAVMESGRIAQVGSGREIYHQPRTRYVADFIGDANLITGVVDADGVLIAGDGDLRLPVRHEGAPGSNVSYLVRPEAISLSLESFSMNDDSICVTATVREIVFVGSSTRVYTQSHGQELICEFPSSKNEAERQVCSKGQTVSLCWHRDNGQVLSL